MFQPLQSNIRPPLVEFFWSETEDRDASIREGRFVSRQVAQVRVTPLGDNAKTRAEHEADSWFANLRKKVQEGQYDADWLTGFEKVYEFWKKGEEIPETGTPIKGWPLLSHAQQQVLVNGGIRVVEDLAAMTDGQIAERGMGWWDYRGKARAFMEAANGPGKLAARLTAMEADNKMRDEREQSQLNKIAELEGELRALQPKKPARRVAEEETPAFLKE